MSLKTQAEELNNILIDNNKIIYELLSEKGRAIYFPKEGILSQSAQAKGKKINATIGTAIEDNGVLASLPALQKNISLPVDKALAYSPSYGLKELREIWLMEIKEKNPSLKDNNVSLPIVTCGVTQGLYLVGSLFVNPGDEIIIPDKMWENYNLIYENNFKAKFVKFNIFDKYNFNISGLKEK